MLKPLQKESPREGAGRAHQPAGNLKVDPISLCRSKDAILGRELCQRRLQDARGPRTSLRGGIGIGQRADGPVSIDLARGITASIVRTSMIIDSSSLRDMLSRPNWTFIASGPLTICFFSGTCQLPGFEADTYLCMCSETPAAARVALGSPWWSWSLHGAAVNQPAPGSGPALLACFSRNTAKVKEPKF